MLVIKEADLNKINLVDVLYNHYNNDGDIQKDIFYSLFMYYMKRDDKYINDILSKMSKYEVVTDSFVDSYKRHISKLAEDELFFEFLIKALTNELTP